MRINEKNSHCFWQWEFSFMGFERREVEKRNCELFSQERLRLTASAAFHDGIVARAFEQGITELRIKINGFVNECPLCAGGDTDRGGMFALQ